MRKRRRILTRIVVLLLFLSAGAIVNVAVAWGLCLFAPLSEGSYSEPIAADTTWLARQGWRELPNTTEFNYRVRADLAEGVGVSFRSLFEARHKAEYSHGFAGPMWNFLMTVVAGWPIPSFEGRAFDDYAIKRTEIPGPAFRNRYTATGLPILYNSKLIGAARLPEQLKLSSRTAGKILPLRPIWPGFAINTLFYAAILALLFYGPGKVRRWIRVHRSQCPACGHIIAAGTCANGLCSECGSPLPKGFKPRPQASAHT